MKFLIGLMLLVSMMFVSGCGAKHKLMKHCKQVEDEFYDCEVP